MNTSASAEHRGHNNPPEGILPVLPPPIAPEAIKDSILAARAAALETAGEGIPPFDAGRVALYAANVASFCDACGAWKDIKTITSAEQSERLTDFVAGAVELAKKIDASRVDEKKAHDDRGKAVQKAYIPLTDKLDRVIELMKDMQADWLKRENDRIAAEKAEAARIAREKADEAARELAAAEARNDVSGVIDAEAKAAEAKKEVSVAAKPVKASAGSASGGGRTMALRTVKTARIDDLRAVFLFFEKHPDVLETIQRLATAAVRASDYVEGSVPGITLITDQVAA